MTGRPQAVAFDIVGTLFPLAPLRAGVVALGLPPAALEGWFAAGLRDAFALCVTGDFQPFTAVLQQALATVLAEQGLPAPEPAIAGLVGELTKLPPRDGAGEAIAALREADVPVYALTNGSAASTRTMLERAGLLDAIERIVSVEEVRLAKPRREVYRHAAEVAGVAPGALALIATHSWDVHGAKAAGLVAGYCSAERPFAPTLRAPDVEAATLPEVACALLALT